MDMKAILRLHQKINAHIIPPFISCEIFSNGIQELNRNELWTVA